MAKTQCGGAPGTESQARRTSRGSGRSPSSPSSPTTPACRCRGATSASTSSSSSPGYLITRCCGRSSRASGRLSFAGFYARRARRLLPSAVLVIVVTVLVSVAVHRTARGDGGRQGRRGLRPLRRQLPLRLPGDELPRPRRARCRPCRTTGRSASRSSSTCVWPALLLVALRSGAACGAVVAATGASPPRRRSRAAGPVLLVLARRRGALLLAVRLPDAREPAVGLLLAADAGVGAGAWAVSSPWRCPTADDCRRGRWRRSAGPASPPWRGRSSPSAPRPFPGPAALVPVAGTGAALVAGTRAMRSGRRACSAWPRCSPSAPSPTPGTSGTGRR